MTTRRNTDSLRNVKAPSEASYGAHMARAINTPSIAGTNVRSLPQFSDVLAADNMGALLAGATPGGIPAVEATVIAADRDNVLAGELSATFPIISKVALERPPT